jgi:hypothetical protein
MPNRFCLGGVSSRLCIRPLYVVVAFRCMRTGVNRFQSIGMSLQPPTHFQPGWCLRVLFEDQMGVFQDTAVGISTGLRHHWEADCEVTFAFRGSSVPAARAGAISGSRSAESKTPSQWNDGSVGGGAATATAPLGELPHAALMLWLITQLHDCTNQFLSLEPNIKVLSSCFGTENAIPALQFTFCHIRNATEFCGASPPERDFRCPIIRCDG